MKESKVKSDKKTIIIVALVIIILVVFLFNLFRTNHNQKESAKVIQANLETISELYSADVQSVEEAIANVKDGQSSEVETGPNYREIFTNCAIIGDSITEGFSAYKFLGEEQVFTTIGASVMHNGELFEQAAKTFPKYAFFSFGMNDIGICSGNSDMFIDEYKTQLKKFKKTSPKTKIYVNSISVPSDEAIQSNAIYGKYIDFNKAIKSMCKELKIEYIDTTEILKNNPDLYGGDGIHVNPGYYPIWMDLMISKAGLK